MRWIIFLPGTYCVQYQWMNEAARKRLHQDNMYIYPSKLQMWTCVHSSKCEMFPHCQVWSPDPTLSGRGCEVPAAGGERRCAGLLGERGSGAGWRFGRCGVAPPSCDPSGRSWAAPLEPKLWAERRRLQQPDRRGFPFGSEVLDQTH